MINHSFIDVIVAVILSSSVSIQDSFGSHSRSFFLAVSRVAFESTHTFGI